MCFLRGPFWNLSPGPTLWYPVKCARLHLADYLSIVSVFLLPPDRDIHFNHFGKEIKGGFFLATTPLCFTLRTDADKDWPNRRAFTRRVCGVSGVDAVNMWIVWLSGKKRDDATVFCVASKWVFVVYFSNLLKRILPLSTSVAQQLNLPKTNLKSYDHHRGVHTHTLKYNNSHLWFMETTAVFQKPIDLRAPPLFNRKVSQKFFLVFF